MARRHADYPLWRGKWRDRAGRWRDARGHFTKPPRIPPSELPRKRRHAPTTEERARSKARAVAATKAWEKRQARQKAAKKAALTRTRRRNALEAARNAPAVSQYGITGIHFDKETGWILGQDATGKSVRAYRVRKRGRKWRTYWAETALLSQYPTGKSFREQYEGLEGYQIKMVW